MREIGRFKPDLPTDSWHLCQQVDRHPVGRVEVNPQTVERYHRIISEPAATFWGGGFVRIAGNSFSQPDASLCEAGN
jgi:hypothetical protein